MRVDATLISATSPAAALATRPPSLPSIPSIFGAKLASFTSSAGAETSQNQSVATARSAESNPKSWVKPDSNDGTNPSSSLNSPNKTSKSAIKADVKLATNLATIPEAVLPAIPPQSAASPADVLLLAGFEPGAFSAPVPNPAHLSANPSPVVAQLNANIESSTLPSPLFAAPVVAPTMIAPTMIAPTMIAFPAQTVTTGDPSPHGMPARSSIPHQIDSTATSAKTIATTSRVASDLGPNFFPGNSGNAALLGGLESLTLAPSALAPLIVANPGQTVTPGQYLSPLTPVPGPLPRETDPTATSANTIPTTGRPGAVLEPTLSEDPVIFPANSRTVSQFAANFESLTSPTPALAPPTLAVPAQTVTPSELSSHTISIASLLSGQDASAASSYKSNLPSRLSAAVLAPNLNEDPTNLPDNSGTFKVPSNVPVLIECGPQPSVDSLAMAHATSGVRPSVPGVTVQLPDAFTQIPTFPVPVSPASANRTAIMSATPNREAGPLSIGPPAHQVLSLAANPRTMSLPASTSNISLEPIPVPIRVSMPTPMPFLSPAPMSHWSSGPAPQSAVSENNLAPRTTPLDPKTLPDSSSYDAKSSDSTPGMVRPDDPTPVSSASAPPAPNHASAVPANEPAAAGSADFIPGVAQSANTPETGFDFGHNVVSNVVVDNAKPSTSNFETNFEANRNSLAYSPAGMVAITSDVAEHAKSGVAAQSGIAVTPSAIADKKSSVAGPLKTPPSAAGTSSAALLFASSPPGVPAGLAAGKDFSVPVTDPAPPVSAPQFPAGPNAGSEFPKTHQILDAAPPAPAPPPSVPIALGSNADLQTSLQMNGQMHVGMRTEAFGAVEIHTVVQQSQIGITVHADRDIARWFSSEVPGLESGLNKSHLNLSAVEFDNGKTSLQTSSSFQQGQSRQQSSQPQAFQPAASSHPGPEKGTAAELDSAGNLSADLSLGPAKTRVSIHA